MSARLLRLGVKHIPPPLAQQRYYVASRFPKGSRLTRPRTKPQRIIRQGDAKPVSHAFSASQPHQEPPIESKQASKAAETSPVPTDPAVLPDAPQDVLQPDSSTFSGATQLLGQSALIITREIEMMNIFLGYEQANRYNVLSPTGENVGYLAEEETGVLGGAIQRQLLKTHRPFKATVMNAEGRPVLVMRRPLTWINSKASVYAVGGDYPIGAGPPQDADLTLIGEAQQRWHVYKRRYELFLQRGDDSFDQFAKIDAGFLSWTFLMQDAEDRLVGAIDRNFRGFGREIFTDTGQYVVRFDSVGQEAMTEQRLQEKTGEKSGAEADSGMALVQSHGTRSLSLDERAVALTTAVSIDFDFFSRHSSGGGMFPWFYMGGGGGEAQGGQGGEPAPDSTGGAAGGAGAGVPPGSYDSPPPTAEQGDAPWWEQQQSDQPPSDADPWGGANDTHQQEGLFGGWGWGGFFEE